MALVNALKRLWLDDFTVTWYAVETWVADQPLSIEETILWSFNRAKNCFKQNSEIDFACGAEWWVYFNAKKTRVYMIGSWITLIDRDGYVSTLSWGEIALPDSFIQPLLDWKELWTIMDELRNTTWANHREWAIGFFSNNTITRSESFESVVVNAFVPWLHPNLYS
jgi:non-canonical (house-cleaning) NTP pyrophosphatase